MKKPKTKKELEAEIRRLKVVIRTLKMKHQANLRWERRAHEDRIGNFVASLV